MESNVVARTGSSVIHILNVITFKDVEVIQNVHRAKPVSTVSAVHLVSVAFQRCVKLLIMRRCVDVRMVTQAMQELDAIHHQMLVSQIHAD